MADQPKDPNTLHIFVDDDGRVHTEGKTPEESEQEIKMFIEGYTFTDNPSVVNLVGNDSDKTPLKITNAGEQKADPPKEETKVDWVTVKEDECRHVSKSDYHGEAFIVEKNATLILHDEVDPIVSLHESELVYDNYSGTFSEQQQKNITSLGDGELTLRECEIIGLLQLERHNTTIEGGNYDDVMFGDYGHEYKLIGGGHAWLYLRDGACIDNLTVGHNTVLHTNSNESTDEDAVSVHIGNLNVYGNAELLKCDIGRVFVGRLSDVDIDEDCNISELAVAGTVCLRAGSSIKTIRLFAGGRVYGDITDRNILSASSRPIQILRSENNIWVFG